MSWPDENIGPVPPRITTRTVSSASAREERVVELDEHAAVLRVPRRRAGSSMIRAIVPSSSVS